MPWFNAEVLLFSAATGVSSNGQLLLLVLGITGGQTVGKALMYWGARRAATQPTPRIQRSLDRWRARLEARPSSAPTLIFVSSAVGFPPLYVVTLAAGAMRVAFWPFFAATGVGRLLHFGLLALIPAFYLLS